MYEIEAEVKIRCLTDLHTFLILLLISDKTDYFFFILVNYMKQSYNLNINHMKVIVFCLLVVLSMSCLNLKNGTRNYTGYYYFTASDWTNQCRNQIDGQINIGTNYTFNIFAKFSSSFNTWKLQWYYGCYSFQNF